MNTDREAGPVEAYAVPPYSTTLALPSALPRRLPRAAVIVLDVDEPSDAAPGLDEAVCRTRKAFPSAPVVLRVPRVSAATMRLAHRAARLRARTVVGADEPLGAVLRAALTRPDDLGDDIVEWLHLRGMRMSPAVADLLRELLGAGHRFPHLADLLAPRHKVGRTARQRFRAEGLPPPSAWHQMARALHHALEVQRQSERSLTALALDLGYADRSGLTRQLIRTFDVTPVAVRGTLGWEWLMDRWLERARRDRNGNAVPLQSLSLLGMDP